MAEVLQSASEELVIAAPYIKQVEANWVCDRLSENRSDQRCRLRVLTDIRSDSILTGFLDVDALELFHKRRTQAEVVSLPRLHAKVYIADTCRALLTSANLTPAGLDHNFEYGICLEDSSLVCKVKSDLDAYARLGNVVGKTELQSLLEVAQRLKKEYEELTKSTSRKLKADFNRTLRQAQTRFLSAQVGKRSAQSLFAEAILYALARGPLPTEQLHPRVQSLLPDLCDDTVELVINGQRFGKRWKHAVRNAQQYLKRSGKIAVDGENWVIVDPPRR
ncbi:MAG: hypothetical protein HYY46_26200 [Deltaproteobacteria bacterium]|nr:hypothetical protein [Deltaproteobacteria bacterium]